MSVNDQITRIRNNVTNSLSAVQEKGVSIPTGANSDNLPGLIAQISGGDATVEEITNEAGGKSVYINSEVPKLPEGFTRLKWIQSGNGQYVDTGFKHDNNTRIIADYEAFAGDVHAQIFGACGSSYAKSMMFLAYKDASKYLVYYNGTRTDFAANTSGRRTIDANKNTYTLDGGTVIASYTAATFQSDFNMYLFAFNNNGTAGNVGSTIRLYSCQIWDNDVLVRDYVPCLNASNVAGLYDMVNGVFYGDAAGGAFVAGPVVLEYELPEGYEELEWIQSTGSQYVDTDFKPNQDSRVVMDAQVVSGTTSFLFGARANSSANAQSVSFSFVQIGGTSLRSDYGATETAVSVNPVQRLRIDKNKNGTTVNGVSVSATVQSFSNPYNLVLFTVNTAGTINATKTAMQLYACQIYDNGTLVRYYVPCRNSGGEVGLWDAVNNTFTGDAAGVGFIAGPRKNVVLPEGYTRLQYIKADGNQYLDTQFVPDTDTRLELDFTWDYIDPTEWTWMSAAGVRDTSSGTMQMHLTAETTQSYAGFSAQEISPTPGFYDPNTRYNIALDKNGVTVNGVQGGTFTAGQTLSTTLSIYLFRRNDNGSPSGNKFYGKVYGGRIIGGTTLARDYIPCRNESGVAGLYDYENGVFYTDNAGVGFLAGPEYAEPVSKVVLEDRVLVDLTSDTVTPESLLRGFTAHDAMGQLIQGAASAGRPVAMGSFYAAKVTQYTLSGLSFKPEAVFVMMKYGSANIANDGQWMLVAYKNEPEGINYYVGAYFNWSYYVDVYEFINNNSYITTTDSGFDISTAGGGRVVNGTYYYICIGPEG